MPLTKDQVVDLLFQHYARAGIDMSYLLSDPTFHSLPAETKIEFIQKHAKELAPRVSTGWMPSDKQDMIYSALKTSAVTSLPAFYALAERHLMANGSYIMSDPAARATLLKVAPYAIGASALLGLGASYLHHASARDARRALKRNLENTAQTGSAVDAAGTLSSAHIFAARSKFLDRIRGDVQSHIEKVPPQIQDKAISDYSQLYNLNKAQP